MPWNRNEPDPIKNKRRQLAEQERLLAEQMARLNEELQQSGQPPIDPKAGEPPVWRMEDETSEQGTAEPTPARKIALARQRQRDMLLFFLFILILLVVLGIVVWVFYTHYAPSTVAP